MMEKLIITKPLQISTQSAVAQLDARSVIDTLDDIFNIECPYVGLIVYCKETRKSYQITELTPIVMNDVFVGYGVKEYTPINVNQLNYLGEFDGKVPSNPENGDWYRDTVSGKSYVYQNEWILMAQDGVNGRNGGFSIYVFKSSVDTPDAPQYADPEYIPTSPEAPEGWSLTVPVTVGDEQTWMSYTQVSPTSQSITWSDPVRLSGKDGAVGKDGASVEFIYATTTGKYGDNGVEAPELIIPEDWESNAEYQSAGYLPNDNNWNDTALPVTPNNQTVWVSSRISKTVDDKLIWQPFSTPAPWSVWGANGMDGDGTAYIYCTSSLSPSTFLDAESDGGGWDNLLKFSDAEIAAGRHLQYDGIPAIATTGLTERRNWTDNPSDVSQTYQYTYVAIRRKINGVWETSFTTPVLWSHYSNQLFRLSVDESAITINCSKEGYPLGSDDGKSFAAKYVDFAVYNGNTNITEQCTFNVETTTANTTAGEGFSADTFARTSSTTGYSLKVEGFADIDTTQAVIKLTAVHPDFGTMSSNIVVKKNITQYQLYTLKCCYASVIDSAVYPGAKIDLVTYESNNAIGYSVYPEYCTFTLYRITQDFLEVEVTEQPADTWIVCSVTTSDGANTSVVPETLPAVNQTLYFPQLITKGTEVRIDFYLNSALVTYATDSVKCIMLPESGTFATTEDTNESRIIIGLNADDENCMRVTRTTSEGVTSVAELGYELNTGGTLTLNNDADEWDATWLRAGSLQMQNAGGELNMTPDGITYHSDAQIKCLGQLQLVSKYWTSEDDAVVGEVYVTEDGTLKVKLTEA